MEHGDREARRLLLIPFAPGIGDVVMMEPLLRAICSHLPDWLITLVAREYAADLLPASGYELVSPRYMVNRAPPPLRPLHRLIPQRLIAWAAEPAMALDLGPFERVINLFWVWESKTPFEDWWTPQYPLRAGVRHTVDLLAEYLEEELGARIPFDQRFPRLRPLPEADAWVGRWLQDAATREPLVALVPSAEHSLKWWAAQKWIQLNEQLTRRGWKTLLIAPHDHPHALRIYEGCKSKPLWPTADLRQLTALLARSDVVVGIDTGPLHMAAAVGARWVGLFGPTNPDVIGPYDRSQGRAVVARFPKPESCRNCWMAFKNRGDYCPTLSATGCTTLIPVEEVLEAVEALREGTSLARSS